MKLQAVSAQVLKVIVKAKQLRVFPYLYWLQIVCFICYKSWEVLKYLKLWYYKYKAYKVFEYVTITFTLIHLAIESKCHRTQLQISYKSHKVATETVGLS